MAYPYMKYNKNIYNYFTLKSSKKQEYSAVKRCISEFFAHNSNDLSKKTKFTSKYIKNFNSNLPDNTQTHKIVAGRKKLGYFTKWEGSICIFLSLTRKFNRGRTKKITTTN
jgi:hypothetical protein